jgi:WhiB family transcriptional regulator, redox-sensing transcriptional regulator
VSCSSSWPAVAVADPWVERAACRDVDPELWFPNDRDPNERAQAIRICGTCDVQAQCLKVARKRRERHGIWGGVDFTK